MKITDLRIDIFYTLLRPFSKWSRKGRMRTLLKIMNLKTDMSILDLGGLPSIWDNIPFKLNITVLNLPGTMERGTPTHHNIRYLEGDACEIPELDDRSFDLVFSNSVIEHVGSDDRQANFAREVRRLGRSYWIQTPSKWFPIEPHCGMPLWWFYPAKLRAYYINGWRRKYPTWTKMVEETTVLSKNTLRTFFPEGTLLSETVFGFTKSYIVYFRGASDS
jgi:Methyltransferase domain